MRIECSAPDRARRCGAGSCGLYVDGVPRPLWRPPSFQLHRSLQQRSPSHKNSCILESRIIYGDQKNQNTDLRKSWTTQYSRASPHDFSPRITWRLHNAEWPIDDHHKDRPPTRHYKKQKRNQPRGRSTFSSTYTLFIQHDLTSTVATSDRRCLQLMHLKKNRLLHGDRLRHSLPLSSLSDRRSTM